MSNPWDWTRKTSKSIVKNPCPSCGKAMPSTYGTTCPNCSYKAAMGAAMGAGQAPAPTMPNLTAIEGHIETITDVLEKLLTRIERIEAALFGMKCECGDPALPDDYLCRKCRDHYNASV